jgi:hypothetical protein
VEIPNLKHQIPNKQIQREKEEKTQTGAGNFHSFSEGAFRSCPRLDFLPLIVPGIVCDLEFEI